VSRFRIKCAHCKRRIRAHEPDVDLRDLDNGGRDRFCNTGCSNAGYAAAESPGLYKLIVRHVSRRSRTELAAGHHRHRDGGGVPR
jgi:hypothetical protein